MSLPIIRPIRLDDFEAVYKLAMQASGGMTNLPRDKDALRVRVESSVKSFCANPKEPGDETYMIVLEVAGAILGIAAVFASIGRDTGFVNYKVNWTFHASQPLDKRIKRRLLVPTHDYTGAGEVGSLFLAKGARGDGFGKFLAKARYLFIAQKPEIIADPICAELRGWRDENGRSPFWDALGQHFFDMDFDEADLYNSSTGNQFIADLMPPVPIYVVLLPKAARDCIGRPYSKSEPALAMLKSEGFEYRDYVDIFDAGPLLSAKKSDIRTIYDSREKIVRIRSSPADDNLTVRLLAAGQCANFRATRASVRESDDDITLCPETAGVLCVGDGDRVRCVEQ
ncbi:MAG: arginine N-succinyltransferase [Pseudomonadota bacterium]